MQVLKTFFSFPKSNQSIYTYPLDPISIEYHLQQPLSCTTLFRDFLKFKLTFNVTSFYAFIIQMENPINLEEFGNKEIPDFILKLYIILEKQEFENIISWTTNGCEVHIKDHKKMEEIILPTYFRHKKIESFIRQLNMYKFGKVNKICKEKKHMFFKNQLFRKGNLKLLHLIKRKKKGQPQCDNGDSDQDFENYKIFIKENVQKIQQNLDALRKKHPQVSDALIPILNFAGALTGQCAKVQQPSQTQESQQIPETKIEQISAQPNLFYSNRNFLNIPMSSLKHFDSKCSIDLVFNQSILI